MGLPKEKAAAMFSLPKEKKWHLITQMAHTSSHPAEGKRKGAAEYVDQVRNALSPGDATASSVHNLANALNGLEVSMRTEAVSWVLDFLQHNGLSSLMSVLLTFGSKTTISSADCAVLFHITRCIKALVNVGQGLSSFMSQPHAVVLLACCYPPWDFGEHSIPAIKRNVLELMSIFCVVPTGHAMVLEAWERYKMQKKELYRFQTIMRDFGANDDDFKRTALIFINAVVNYPETAVERQALRFEFVDAGLSTELEALRASPHEDLQTQISVFEDEAEYDGETLDLPPWPQDLSFDQSELQSFLASLDEASLDLCLKFLAKLQYMPEDAPRRVRMLRLLNQAIHHLILDPMVNANQQQLTASPTSPIVSSPIVQTAEAMQVKEELLSELEASKQVISKLEVDLQATQAKLKAEEARTKSTEAQLNDKLVALEKNHSVTVAMLQNKLEAAKLEQEQALSAIRKEAEVKSQALAATIKNLQAAIQAEVSQQIKLEDVPQLAGLSESAWAALYQVLLKSGARSSTAATTAATTSCTFSQHQCGFSSSPASSSTLGICISRPPSTSRSATPTGCSCTSPAAWNGDGSPSGPPPPPKKPEAKPSVKVRNLAWSKVNATAPAAVWKSLEAAPDVKLDLKELESMFAVAATAPSPKASGAGETGAAAKSNAAAIAKISLIDSKRAYNLSIMLGRLKLSFNDIRDALIAMQETKLDLQLVTSIKANCPTSDDEQALAEYLHASPEKLAELDRPDQFLVAMISVPRLPTRLDCWLFKAKFGERVEELSPMAKSIASACKVLRESEALKKSLKVILTVGNFINAGSFRGNAQGFSIDLLGKLADVKLNGPNKQNLFHYIATVLKDDVGRLEKDFSPLDAAARVSLMTLQQEVKELAVGFGKVRSELEHHEPSTPFHSVMSHFVSTNTAAIDALGADSDAAGSDFKSSVEAFGEDPTTATPETFFTIFKTFATSLARAHKENLDRELKAAKAAKTAATAVNAFGAGAAGAKKGAGPAGNRPRAPTVITSDLPAPQITHTADTAWSAGHVDNRKGVADELLATLKNGDAFRRRRDTAGLSVDQKPVQV
ncbi:formin homology 2 domain-domain-containing protein [Catenaria anguillulae PL171]|uniref:Formin homology 2 domain-domain-containing protein n=1 Tax=Catenaria anguillulae PL171 TaxID=765915 RepID=A0A1Y2HDC1_9FUNG|nr:formin homology 2 domain-domain-containing protein [Catenaria anguillulae PL171]